MTTGYSKVMGQDSTVGIGTYCGLDSLGFECWWGQDFPHPSRLALAPTQPSIQWAMGLARG